jgi:hypothetical protein
MNTYLLVALCVANVSLYGMDDSKKVPTSSLEEQVSSRIDLRSSTNFQEMPVYQEPKIIDNYDQKSAWNQEAPQEPSKLSSLEDNKNTNPFEDENSGEEY